MVKIINFELYNYIYIIGIKKLSKSNSSGNGLVLVLSHCYTNVWHCVANRDPSRQCWSTYHPPAQSSDTVLCVMFLRKSWRPRLLWAAPSLTGRPAFLLQKGNRWPQGVLTLQVCPCMEGWRALPTNRKSDQTVLPHTATHTLIFSLALRLCSHSD
jgi:hypothetical protein